MTASNWNPVPSVQRIQLQTQSDKPSNFKAQYTTVQTLELGISDNI